jgi:peptidoglycan/LPS O-acetylase OafA/YrhL
VAAGCGLLLFLNRLYHHHYSQFLQTQGILIMDATVACFVVAHASWEPLETRKGRIYAVLALLGVLSYGVYAWHAFIMNVMGPEADEAAPWSAGRFVVLVALTVAAAGLSYWLVERPALSMKARRPRHPDGSATLEPDGKEHHA